MREHLQLTIKETTTYTEIRETVLSHEQASKTWSQESVTKSLNVKPDPNGPAPMDVDRIQEKGKGKGKYKGKGKQNGKSKGKQKGKYAGKKGDDVGQNQCRICYGNGHWSRDCPQRVQQVTETNIQQQNQQQQSRQMSTTNTTASASNASTLNTAVRRIFHIRPPSVSTYADSSVCVIIQEIDEAATTEVCRHVVILDSGSDVSLLPLSYANKNLGERNVRLQIARYKLEDCR